MIAPKVGWDFVLYMLSFLHSDSLPCKTRALHAYAGIDFRLYGVWTLTGRSRLDQVL